MECCGYLEINKYIFNLCFSNNTNICTIFVIIIVFTINNNNNVIIYYLKQVPADVVESIETVIEKDRHALGITVVGYAADNGCFY